MLIFGYRIISHSGYLPGLHIRDIDFLNSSSSTLAESQRLSTVVVAAVYPHQQPPTKPSIIAAVGYPR